MVLFNDMSAELITSIDNICISLLLGILGVAITIFTVVYSFMESNKQAIRRITDEIKISEIKDPVQQTDLLFATEYMSRMKRANCILIAIIASDIILFIFFCVYLSIKTIVLQTITYALIFILFLACLLFLYFYLRQYISRYKKV